MCSTLHHSKVNRSPPQPKPTAMRRVIIPQRSIHYELFFQCKTCNSVFPTYTGLSLHLDLHAEASAMLHNRGIINGDGESRHFRPSPRDVHECSICGMTFTRGQALGGHMKSHNNSCRLSEVVGGGKKAKLGGSSRSTSTAAATAATPPPTNADRGQAKGNVRMLDFDLNKLPMETEDDGGGVLKQEVDRPILR